MAIHQSPGQKRTVERVMHEFKHGELNTARGTRKVKNPKQAIAIALHEAGASNQESTDQRPQPASHQVKGRRGETYRDEVEGRPSTKRTYARGQRRADLYAEAKRRDIRGRSKMSKAELERALHRR